MTTTRLSALLHRPVVDERGEQLGVVHDVVAVQAGPVTGGLDARIEVTALLIGARGVRDRLGLSPAHVRGPLPMRILCGAGRSTDTIPWRDVTSVEDDRIVVRRRSDPGEAAG
jgi:sporulation protein YlmC with PRC-barrel domain